MSEANNNFTYEKKTVYEKAGAEVVAQAYEYAKEYMAFLDAAKTEREAVAESVRMAEAAGYRPYHFGDAMKAGDRFYYNNRGKGIFLFKIGTEHINNGIRITAAHIDSPRLDLKQVPVFEDHGMCYLKTHYYGGIRKYQWATIPLALHGVVALADGNVLQMKIGDEEGDPVFYISDLLPHLAAKQNAKPLGEGIGGEDLNIWFGNIPYTAAKDEKDKTVKENLLRILNEKYGIAEADFMSAELCLVPAYNAKDVGFDRALIGSYGHDDRVCSYPAYTALFDTVSEEHTVMVVLADKEEIGSEGSTGMQCAIFTDLIDEIARSFGVSSAAIRAHSKCLSADVNAGYDPNFPDVLEKQNATYVSHGAGVTKFTGARGKSGSSDADAEYVAYLRKIFDENGVIWQTGELGKVDVGGGGTVAKFIAKMNIDTIDIGVPVISMHAPYEVVSKADVYETYLAFKAFLK